MSAFSASSAGGAPRLYFSFDDQPYEGPEPYFFDPAEHPWVKILEDNWRVIREELMPLFQPEDPDLKPYFNAGLAFPPGNWKTFGFYWWKTKNHENCARFPRTAAVLESIPHLIAGSLSRLEPKSQVLGHHGDTNAIIRGHLALEIPGRAPECAFQVGTEVRSWEEGKMLLFCDAHHHQAWNHTGRRRVILIVDVVRPEFARRTDAICQFVLATMFRQYLRNRFTGLKNLPGWLDRGLLLAVRGLMVAYLPWQRRFDK